MQWRYFFEILYLVSCLIPFRSGREWFRREKLFDYKSKLNALRRNLPDKDWRHFRLAKGGGSLAFITGDNVYKIRKFHLHDNALVKFMREKRITDALAPILPIQIPQIQIYQFDGYTVYATKFIKGCILLNLPLKKIREHRAQLAAELANIITIMFDAKLPELDDLRPAQQFGDTIGMVHGDMCSNILIDPQTMHIVGIIDWEYAGFGSLKREFFGLFRVRKKMRLTDIAPEVMWNYYANKSKSSAQGA